MAYATPVFWFTARQKSDSGFAVLYRLGLIPMMLFSGAFFPISQMPDAVEWLAYLMPVWHGVELCRGLTLGAHSTTPSVGHLGYLLAWLVVGWVAARHQFERRLVEGTS
jgi:lipooligosaccharide transport system permease protein